MFNNSPHTVVVKKVECCDCVIVDNDKGMSVYQVSNKCIHY